MGLLKRLISLNNLIRPGVEAGQVATLLILIMIIGLILVMATVNIGQVAVNSTALSNAADTAALSLASSLATKSRMYWEGLGNTFEHCEKRNLLGLILALIIAIIITIVTWGCAWYTIILAAAVGGAVGGMIGAMITGTNIGSGILMGAMIGAAVGSVAVGVQNITVLLEDAAFLSSGMSGPTLAGSAMTFTVFGSVYLGAAVSMASGLMSLWNRGDMAINMERVILDQLSKQLGKLDEQSQYRETTIFAALARTIDDPVKVPDVHDLDADQDTTEPTSRFLTFWWERIGVYAALSEEWATYINDFVGKMQNFRNVIVPAYNGTPTEVTVYIYTDPLTGEVVTSETYPEGLLPSSFSYNPVTTETRTKILPGMLERQDYKWSLEQVTIDGEQDMQEVAMAGPCVGQGVEDGSIVGFMRPLYALGYTTPYWQPGPSDTPCEKNDPMNAWMDIDCSSGDVPSSLPVCSPSDTPAGYDDIDGMADGLRAMVVYMDTIVPPTFDEFMAQYYPNVNLTISEDYEGTYYFSSNWMRAQYEAQYNAMVAEMNPVLNWQDWVYSFYNPDDPADPDTYYVILANYIATLENIKSALQALNLPLCGQGCFEADGITCDVGACTGGWQSYQCPGWEPWEWAWGPPPQNCIMPSPGWPCKLHQQGCIEGTGITIDQNIDDELQPVLNDIDRMIAEMTNFRDQIKAFADQMFGVDIVALGDCAPGNHNCVQYIWQDSRGTNTIRVEVGPFKMPRLHRKSSFWKVCMQLKDYTDDNRCWVKVTKYESAPNVGIFGKWNPFRRGITRISKVGYGPGAGDIWDIWIKDTRR